MVVVLPGMNVEDLQPSLDRIQLEVKRLSMEEFGEDVISLSAGEAQLGRDGTTAEDLLSEADRRMYGNKKKRKTVPWPRTVEIQDSQFATAR